LYFNNGEVSKRVLFRLKKVFQDLLSL